MASFVRDRVSANEREKIIDLLHEHGGNRSKVAKLTARSSQTVCNIANQERIPTMDNPASETARKARKAYEAVDRMGVINLGIEVGEKLLASLYRKRVTPEVMRSYKDCMTGLAIAIDKHRLETGDVTDRTQTNTASTVANYFAEAQNEVPVDH
jgi:hypothetical protein